MYTPRKGKTSDQALKKTSVAAEMSQSAAGNERRLTHSRDE